MTMTFHDTVPLTDAANASRWAAHAASEIDDDEPYRKPMTPAEAVVALCIWLLSGLFVLTVVLIAWERLQTA